MIEYVTVVVIKDNVIDESFLFFGEHDEIAEKAETKFLELCASGVSNWDEYTFDDIEAVLEDGYTKKGNGSICITWPYLEGDDV